MALFFECGDAASREGAIQSAAASVAAGELVVLPTDTVYGVGADAFDGDAVNDLLTAKGRGRDTPVPVLVGSWNTIDGLVTVVDSRLRDLIEAFWPGGLTLVVRHAPSLSWDLGDVNGTVAVRMPLHPVAIELLEQTGPMAVSSANRHGFPPAQTAAEAQEQLGEDIAVYLEDGPVGYGPGGVASTIVDVSEGTPRLLRLGALSVAQLREVVPDLDATGFEDAPPLTPPSAPSSTPPSARPRPRPRA